MSIYSGIRMFCMLVAMMAFQGLSAQHYIFIEADGQQPFYLKQGNTMVSSSASGFLIIPKITASEMEFSIGFPKNIYPEVSFYINGTDRDRGFQLKLMEGQGWSLFDRTSLEVIKGEVPKAAPVQMNLPQKEEGGFAKLFAIATDDKSLLEKMPKKDSVEKTSPGKAIITKGSTVVATKSGLKDSLSKKDKVILPPISMITQMEDEDVKRFVYVEKTIKGTADTIPVEIEKQKIVAKTEPLTQPQDTTMTATPPKASPIIVCDRPIADYKDIRSLQKKLLGIVSDEGQRMYAVKIFGQKCFNCKQALEIGWFFVDENSRLQLFKVLKPLIADKASFGSLEVSFFKEENITAFRALVAGTN